MPTAAAAPKVTKAQAAKIASIVGGSTKPKRRRTPTPATVTRHAGLRQQQRVEAGGKLQEQRVAASAAMERNKVAIRAEQEQRQSAAKQRHVIRSKVVKAPLQVAGSINSGLANAGSPVPSPAKSVVNPVLLILFMWAGIVILYTLITTPGTENAGKFMASLRRWVSLIYSTKPLFSTQNMDKLIA